VPFLINAYAVLSLSIATECFQPICRRYSKIIYFTSSMNHN
jgi:hypothetical protein